MEKNLVMYDGTSEINVTNRMKCEGSSSSIEETCTCSNTLHVPAELPCACSGSCRRWATFSGTSQCSPTRTAQRRVVERTGNCRCSVSPVPADRPLGASPPPSAQTRCLA